MVVRSKIRDADILKWHDILEDFYTSKMTRQEFCDQNGYSYNEFNQYHSRIFYKSITHPRAQENLINHVQSPEFQSMNIRNYIAKYKLERTQLREAQRFLHYQNLIKENRPNSILSTIADSPYKKEDVIFKPNDAYTAPEKIRTVVEVISSNGMRVSIPVNSSPLDVAKIIGCLSEMHE